MTSFFLKVYRGSPGKQYWESFSIEKSFGMNVISALLEIRKSPINVKGERVAPIVWEDACLEEVCGSCSMLVNARPRQACAALIDSCLIDGVVTLAPLRKFPLMRDLVVDRSSMFENLKKVKAWIEADGSQHRGAGPKISPERQELMYTLSTCMTCGCCSESCPQVNEHSPFQGPAAIAQARLFNAHPTGAYQASERLRALSEEGGPADCGNAQNCQRVCPKKLPLVESISLMNRRVNQQVFRDLFGAVDD